MKKETIGEKEINLSHDISGRKNVRKEIREFCEFHNLYYLMNNNRKTA